jgi:arylsulfatase A-like enzyme
MERVVLVTIDTLRADHVGCYGAKEVETATLDGIAARGVRFETAISPAPITLPGHTTLLTGLDPPGHGVRNNGNFRLRETIPTLAEAMHARGFATAAFVSAFVLDARFGLARGFDVYDDRLGLHPSPQLEVTVGSRAADRTVDAALAWLDGAPERFLLWVHLYDPHAAYQPPEPYASRFGTRLYDGEIAFADAELGRLLRRVRERWGERGTLVIATSDHGESLGEHGEPTHALSVYDATQRVPLVMAGPALPPGRLVAGSLAVLADVAPTILDLAGLPALPGATGRSLRPQIEGNASGPEAAWVETLATQLELGWSPLLGVRTLTHKYIRAPRPELYDLVADPHELVNRAEEEPARVAQLDALVAARAGRAATPQSIVLDAGERARLEALGYLAAAAPASAESLGVVGGPNPKDQMPILAQLFEATALLGRDRPREALERLAPLGPLGAYVELLRAQAALGAGELALARAMATRSLSLSPDADALVLLGRIAEAEGLPERARADYEHALSLDPASAAAVVGLGRVDETAGRRGDARRRYQEAQALPTPDAEAIWRLAALELEDNRPDAANALLASLPQAEVRKPAAATRLARAELARGRPELARTRIRGGLRAYPESSQLRAVERELTAPPGERRRPPP